MRFFKSHNIKAIQGKFVCLPLVAYNIFLHNSCLINEYFILISRTDPTKFQIPIILSEILSIQPISKWKYVYKHGCVQWEEIHKYNDKLHFFDRMINYIFFDGQNDKLH